MIFIDFEGLDEFSSQGQNKCPNCFRDEVIKSGYIKGIQRWKCKHCGFHFRINPRKDNTIDDRYKLKAIQMYLEGLSANSIEKILGISRSAVAVWMKKYIHEDIIKLRPAKRVKYTAMLIKQDELKKICEQSDFDSLVLTRLGNERYSLIKWKAA